MKKPPAKKLPLFNAPRLKTSHAVTIRIYDRPDSPYLQVSVRGQRIGFVRRSSKTRELSTASQFADLLVKHLQREIDTPQPVAKASCATQNTLL